MCDYYSELEANFAANQRIFGFFGSSNPNSKTVESESLAYLGVYYQTCDDPCQVSKVTLSTVSDFDVSFLG